MKVILNFTVVPIDAGISLSKYVAACEGILAESGLKTQLHANGTNIEGDWDEVLSAVKGCIDEVHGMGVKRIHTVLQIGTRIDRDQTMEYKVRSVREKLIT